MILIYDMINSNTVVLCWMKALDSCAQCIMGKKGFASGFSENLVSSLKSLKVNKTVALKASCK